MRDKLSKQKEKRLFLFVDGISQKSYEEQAEKLVLFTIYLLQSNCLNLRLKEKRERSQRQILKSKFHQIFFFMGSFHKIAFYVSFP